ncbi:MAG: TIGR00269 family protein [Nanoarchaeota archaeon]|nr:TIGR00269 family protein [Nanoarchaeota archaeon]
MNCCNEKPIIELTAGEKLCKQHFTEYFENKVFKTITKFDLIGKEENLGVAVSGGKDSLTLLNILNKLSKQNPKIKLTAIAINEGIEGYRDKSLITAQNFCDKLNIKLNIYSYEKEFGMPLDNMLKVLDVKPCTICGIFRRYLLNKKSKELGFTKLATGHNLDDECQSIMMNQFKNNIHSSARLGPKVGINENKNFVQRIKPLYLCTEKEVTTYAFVNNILDNFIECPNIGKSYRAQIRDMLNDFEAKFPGTKYSIVNSFLQILPDLKQRFKDAEVNYCSNCNEPASKDKCNACKYVEKLNKAKNKPLIKIK